MLTNLKQKLHFGVTSTCLYGKNEENSIIHDIKDVVGKSILDYSLIKIKCQLKSGVGIYGLQLIYKNLITDENKALINIIPKDPNLIEQEMNLNVENVSDVKIWINDEIKLIGFEIKTNRGKYKKFGYGNLQELRFCHQLKNNERAVIGFGFIESKKKGIIAMYMYHVNRIIYSFYLYNGIFSLRIRARNDKYKNELEKKANKCTDINKKLLYNVCCLPDNQFFNIIKFTLY